MSKMSKMKRILPLALTLVLCLGMITGCGKEESVPVENTKKEVALTGEVKMVAAEGAGYVAVSKLGSDYSVDKVEDMDAVVEAVKEDKYDFAVMDAQVAAELYEEEQGFKAIMPVYIADWKIALNQEEKIEEPSIHDIYNRVMYVQESEKSAVDVLNLIMKENDRQLYTSQIVYGDENTLKAVSKEANSRILGKGQVIDEAAKESENLQVLFSVNELWNETFRGDIPGQILIVNEDFLENRCEEVRTILNHMADNMKDAQKETSEKLVVYNSTNRGVSIIRTFNEALGLEMPLEFYFSE